MPVFLKFDPDIDGEIISPSTDATPYGEELYLANDTTNPNSGGDSGCGENLYVSGADPAMNGVGRDLFMRQAGDANDVHEQPGTSATSMIFDSAAPTGSTVLDVMDDFMP